MTVVGLNGKDIVSVSRYKDKKHPMPSMVYRYTFRGDFNATIKAFQSRLTKSGGWALEWKVTNVPGETEKIAVLSRRIAAGPVAMQALVFNNTHLVLKDHVWRPASPAEAKGWIWVSYNELLRSPK